MNGQKKTKKLKSLGGSDKKKLIDPKLENLSVSQQCELLNLNRSTFYCTAKVNNKKDEIKMEIAKVFAKTPIYGAKKVHQQLLQNGVNAWLIHGCNISKGAGFKGYFSG